MRPVGFHNEIQKNLKKCIKRVNKGSGWKKIKNCPVCKFKKKNFFNKTKYKNF